MTGDCEILFFCDDNVVLWCVWRPGPGGKRAMAAGLQLPSPQRSPLPLVRRPVLLLTPPPPSSPEMFSTFLTAALFIAPAIQGALADCAINSPALVQVFYTLGRRVQVAHSPPLSAKTRPFPGSPPRDRTTSSSSPPPTRAVTPCKFFVCHFSCVSFKPHVMQRGSWRLQHDLHQLEGLHRGWQDRPALPPRCPGQRGLEQERTCRASFWGTACLNVFFARHFSDHRWHQL